MIEYLGRFRLVLVHVPVGLRLAEALALVLAPLVTTNGSIFRIVYY